MRWRRGWSTARVGRHGMIECARRDSAAINTMERRFGARKEGASPQARWVRCGPIDGGHARSSRDCHSSARVRWGHGWSTAIMGRDGNVEYARRDGAILGTMERYC